MGLATLLVMNGQRYSMEHGVMETRNGRPRPACVWVFPNTETALKLQREYEARTALVEPNRFVKVWALVRYEMMEFLGAADDS